MLEDGHIRHFRELRPVKGRLPESAPSGKAKSLAGRRLRVWGFPGIPWAKRDVSFHTQHRIASPRRVTAESHSCQAPHTTHLYPQRYGTTDAPVQLHSSVVCRPSTTRRSPRGVVHRARASRDPLVGEASARGTIASARVTEAGDAGRKPCEPDLGPGIRSGLGHGGHHSRKRRRRCLGQHRAEQRRGGDSSRHDAARGHPHGRAGAGADRVPDAAGRRTGHRRRTRAPRRTPRRRPARQRGDRRGQAGAGQEGSQGGRGGQEARGGAGSGQPRRQARVHQLRRPELPTAPARSRRWPVRWCPAASGSASATSWTTSPAGTTRRSTPLRAPTVSSRRCRRSKYSSAGSDWRTNPATQIKWGLNYMDSRYGSPCDAWSFWQANHWY